MWGPSDLQHCARSRHRSQPGGGFLLGPRPSLISISASCGDHLCSVGLPILHRLRRFFRAVPCCCSAVVPLKARGSNSPVPAGCHQAAFLQLKNSAERTRQPFPKGYPLRVKGYPLRVIVGRSRRAFNRLGRPCRAGLHGAPPVHTQRTQAVWRGAVLAAPRFARFVPTTTLPGDLRAWPWKYQRHHAIIFRSVALCVAGPDARTDRGRVWTAIQPDR